MADEQTASTEQKQDELATDAVDEQAQAAPQGEAADVEEEATISEGTAAEAAAEADEGTVVESMPESPLGDDEPLITPGMNWFVLRVASNKEDSVRETLLKKVKIEGFTHLVNRILVPTEKVKTIKAGKQRIQLKKLYPGYVFVEMKLENDGRIPQDIFFLIKETTGVGDFIGTAGRPSPMSIPEIEKMMLASKPAEEEAELKMEFQKGDHIKVREGAFANMEGTVDELLPDQGKVRVIVTIFGRATPLEIEYWQIEKFEEE